MGPNSGLAGIAYWLNENYHLQAGEAMDKHDPIVTGLKDWIDAVYAEGRQTNLTTHEIEEQVEKISGGKLRRL